MIEIGVAFDHAGLETPLEEVTGAHVAAVEPHRVQSVQPLHPLRELRLGGLNEEVEVVVEEDPGVELPAVALLCVDQQREPRGSIGVVDHDCPLLDAAAYDVVPGGARQL